MRGFPARRAEQVKPACVNVGRAGATPPERPGPMPHRSRVVKVRETGSLRRQTGRPCCPGSHRLPREIQSSPDRPHAGFGRSVCARCSVMHGGARRSGHATDLQQSEPDPPPTQQTRMIPARDYRQTRRSIAPAAPQPEAGSPGCSESPEFRRWQAHRATSARPTSTAQHQPADRPGGLQARPLPQDPQPSRGLYQAPRQ